MTGLRLELNTTGQIVDVDLRPAITVNMVYSHEKLLNALRVYLPLFERLGLRFENHVETLINFIAQQYETSESSAGTRIVAEKSRVKKPAQALPDTVFHELIGPEITIGNLGPINVLTFFKVGQTYTLRSVLDQLPIGTKDHTALELIEYALRFFVVRWDINGWYFKAAAFSETFFVTGKAPGLSKILPENRLNEASADYRVVGTYHKL